MSKAADPRSNPDRYLAAPVPWAIASSSFLSSNHRTIFVGARHASPSLSPRLLSRREFPIGTGATHASPLRNVLSCSLAAHRRHREELRARGHGAPRHFDKGGHTPPWECPVERKP